MRRSALLLLTFLAIAGCRREMPAAVAAQEGPETQVPAVADVGQAVEPAKGSVKDEQEKAAAEEVAGSTEGVTDVVNMITPVTGGTP